MNVAHEAIACADKLPLYMYVDQVLSEKFDTLCDPERGATMLMFSQIPTSNFQNKQAPHGKNY